MTARSIARSSIAEPSTGTRMRFSPVAMVTPCAAGRPAARLVGGEAERVLAGLVRPERHLHPQAQGDLALPPGQVVAVLPHRVQAGPPRLAGRVRIEVAG